MVCNRNFIEGKYNKITTLIVMGQCEHFPTNSIFFSLKKNETVFYYLKGPYRVAYLELVFGGHRGLSDTKI